MSTTPATIAAAVLAFLYAGAAGALTYALYFVLSRGVGPVEAAPAMYPYVAAMVVLALLWLWTALCCWRRTPSLVVLATIGITLVLLVNGVVGHLTGDEPVEALALGHSVFEGVLVAIVIARRPRAAATTPPAPARAAPAR